MLSGCTTTLIFSKGMSNSHFASITSKPLLSMVAESTEILRPMDQLGCLQACAGVTLSSKLRSVSLKGPPEAVRIISLICEA